MCDSSNSFLFDLFLCFSFIFFYGFIIIQSYVYHTCVAPGKVNTIAVASNCSFNITWEEPQEPNGIISYYLVRLTIGSTNGVVQVSKKVNTTSLTVEELSELGSSSHYEATVFLFLLRSWSALLCLHCGSNIIW